MGADAAADQSTELEIVTQIAATFNEVTSISVHPLAIVAVSDQYTRITCGGAPPSCNSDSITGLLFGTITDDDNGVVVTDAEDIEFINMNPQIAVQLHQAVYTKHVVIGWYRAVTTTSSMMQEPSEEDIRISQHLLSIYPTAHTFGLLTVTEDDVNQDDSKPKNDDVAAVMKDVGDEEDELMLPWSMYRVDVMPPLTVVAFIHITVQLQTSIPERIAVERVIQDNDSSNESTKYAIVSNSTNTTQQSLQALQQRIGILQKYAANTANVCSSSTIREIQTIIYSSKLMPRNEPSSSVQTGTASATSILEDIGNLSELIQQTTSIAMHEYSISANNGNSTTTNTSVMM